MERVWGIEKRERADGRWFQLGVERPGQGRRDVRRLGRCCQAIARDLLGLSTFVGPQLNASSSRKYVMVIPSGLMGMSSFGTWDLKTKTKLAV